MFTDWNDENPQDEILKGTVEALFDGDYVDDEDFLQRYTGLNVNQLLSMVPQNKCGAILRNSFLNITVENNMHLERTKRGANGVFETNLYDNEILISDPESFDMIIRVDIDKLTEDVGDLLVN